MILPKLQSYNRQKQQLIQFAGYNHGDFLQDGEMYDMKNLSCRKHPLIAVRKPRETVQTFVNPKGIMSKDKLCYVDGTAFFYDGVNRGTVTDSEKQLLAMGAYVLIFPDQKYYLTTDNTFGSLTAEWTQETEATFTNVFLSESEVSETEAMVYVRITCTGIGENFNQYDAVEISGITADGLTDLNTTKIIQDKDKDYITIIGVDIDSLTQAAGIQVKRKCPDMDYVIELDNRIWGCSSENHEIYACKLGDPFNWYSFEGISTDSYAVTVGTDGNFTGAIAYMGYALFFKEDCIHKLWGNKPSNYQLSTQTVRGVEAGSSKSLAIVGETLFYKSREGIVTYDGGMPYSVYEKFGATKYKNAVSGSEFPNYYVSMQDGDTWHMFVYNVSKGLWNREDNTHAKYFMRLNGILHYVDAATNELIKISGNGKETIEWFAEFGDDTVYTVNKKRISRINIRCELEHDAILSVHIRYDSNGLWENVYTVTEHNKRMYDIPIIPRNCDHFRIKITGCGDATIHAIAKTLEIGE